jgi:hypothetical protein
MRLAQPFYRLPLRFDVARLRAEVAALPESAWARHPNEIEGNSSARLISVDGGENDDVFGVMRPTAHLRNSPYIRQILAGFGVVWSRSRLMRLAPRAGVPQHADINYHWHYRVRLHIPVVTHPTVRFVCDDQAVHMAAGEAWVFDNWRLHRVEHSTPDERIHLVADTTGTAAFWQFVAGSQRPGVIDQSRSYEPDRDLMPLTETCVPAAVMHPAEIELLLLDFRSELVANGDTPELQSRLAAYHALLDGFCRDWRQLYLLHGDAQSGWPEFERLRDTLRSASKDVSQGLFMRMNRMAAHTVLEARLLRAALQSLRDRRTIAAAAGPASAPLAATATGSALPGPARCRLLQRPTFIVAAPRSGSTLLFETLAASTQVATLGGEAHWLIEEHAGLRPDAPGVDSNRLLARNCTPAIAARITARLLEQARRTDGTPVEADAALGLVEKTPKNALRIPFLDALFPDARFIFLWRDPRENLASIIEAWKSGRWKTYNGMDGFDAPWSLLLPPGWRALRGKPLEEIAAFQWDSANRYVLDDLAALDPARWTSMSYAELLADAAGVAAQLCHFLDMPLDNALRARVTAPLPLSRQTHTPPAPDKWRANATLIERVLPTLEPTWQRLRALRPA